MVRARRSSSTKLTTTRTPVQPLRRFDTQKPGQTVRPMKGLVDRREERARVKRMLRTSAGGEYSCKHEMGRRTFRVAISHCGVPVLWAEFLSHHRFMSDNRHTYMNFHPQTPSMG